MELTKQDDIVATIMEFNFNTGFGKMLPHGKLPHISNWVNFEYTPTIELAQLTKPGLEVVAAPIEQTPGLYKIVAIVDMER